MSKHRTSRKRLSQLYLACRKALRRVLAELGAARAECDYWRERCIALEMAQEERVE